MSVYVQKAEIGDIELLLSLRAEVLRSVFNLPENAEISMLIDNNRAYYERALKDNSHCACFARLNGVLAACGGICYYSELPSPDNPTGRCGLIMNVYTRPSFRSRGLAKTVVSWLINDARAKGVNRVFLETTELGRPLYEGLGFRPADGYMNLTSLAPALEDFDD